MKNNGAFMSVREELRKLILENYLFSDNQDDLKDDVSFMDLGVIDSTGIMEVVIFMEENFGIKVLDTDLLPENLDSINALVAFVDRKKAA
jgi:acyl carrier protein